MVRTVLLNPRDFLLPWLYIPILFFFTTCASAQTSVYEITNCQQLQSMLPNQYGIKYALVNDIDCSDVDFQPIGNGTLYFMGELEGNNYTINNLVINTTNDHPIVAGMFGLLNYAKIQNIRFENANVTTGSVFSGLLAGYALNSHIKHITIADSQLSTHNNGVSVVGGLVGYNASNIENSCSDMTIQGRDRYLFAGGLIGINRSGKIRQSCSMGSLTGHGVLGGLVGYNLSDFEYYGLHEPIHDGDTLSRLGTIHDSYSLADLTISSNNSYVGGLIGASVGLEVRNFYAGRVNNPLNAWVGGITGYSQNPKDVYSNSFWDMEKSGVSSDPVEGQYLHQRLTSDQMNNPANYYAFMSMTTSSIPVANGAWDFHETWWINPNDSTPHFQWWNNSPQNSELIENVWRHLDTAVSNGSIDSEDCPIPDEHIVQDVLTYLQANMKSPGSIQTRSVNNSRPSTNRTINSTSDSGEEGKSEKDVFASVFNQGNINTFFESLDGCSGPFNIPPFMANPITIPSLPNIKPYPNTPEQENCCIAHDFCYRQGGGSKEDKIACDDALWECLENTPTPPEVDGCVNNLVRKVIEFIQNLGNWGYNYHNLPYSCNINHLDPAIVASWDSGIMTDNCDPCLGTDDICQVFVRDLNQTFTFSCVENSSTEIFEETKDCRECAYGYRATFDPDDYANAVRYGGISMERAILRFIIDAEVRLKELCGKPEVKIQTTTEYLNPDDPNEVTVFVRSSLYGNFDFDVHLTQQDL